MALIGDAEEDIHYQSLQRHADRIPSRRAMARIVAARALVTLSIAADSRRSKWANDRVCHWWCRACSGRLALAACGARGWVRGNKGDPSSGCAGGPLSMPVCRTHARIPRQGHAVHAAFSRRKNCCVAQTVGCSMLSFLLSKGLIRIIVPK